MSFLILARHGEHALKPSDTFAGWLDIPLSNTGIKEAIECAKELESIELDIAFASKLARTQETLLIILSRQKKIGVLVHEEVNDEGEAGKNKWYSYPKHLSKGFIPIYSTSSLNERYYGKLQGRKKQKMEEKYGVEKFTSWRLGFEPFPPEGESLKKVYERVVPYLRRIFCPQ